MTDDNTFGITPEKGSEMGRGSPRAEAIEGIRRQLREGTYHRDEDVIARKVLQDFLTTSP